MATKHLYVPSSLRVLRRRDVESLCGLRRSTIYLKMSQDAFPKQVTLGAGRAVGWVESEIIDWLERQIASSRGK